MIYHHAKTILIVDDGLQMKKNYSSEASDFDMLSPRFVQGTWPSEWTRIVLIETVS